MTLPDFDNISMFVEVEFNASLQKRCSSNHDLLCARRD